MPIITVRCIKSFEYGTVFYIPLKVEPTDTLQTIVDSVRERVATETRYRPLQTCIDSFDLFKVYCLPGHGKPANPIISPEGQEFPKAVWASTLTSLSIPPETELSFFSIEAYKNAGIRS